MTNPIDPSHVTRLVDSARRSLEQAGEPGHDVRLVGPPVVTARSRLYLLGRIPPTADYVLKEPLAGDAAVDTDPPLSARAQFEALKLASAWQGAGSAVSRPVALLEGSGAFLMEHVSGRSFTRELRLSVARPADARRAVATAGNCLRALHEHGRRSRTEVGLHDLAEEVRQVADAVPRPVGSRLPEAVEEALVQVPATVVPVIEVLKHGDFVPSNLIVTGPGHLTLIDPVLHDVGLPEDDLARFLSVLSSETVFVAGAVVPGPARRRRDLEELFRATAGPTGNDPRLLELRLLGQYVVRWVRRRGLTRLPEHSLPARMRRRLVDTHMRQLLVEASQRLAGLH
jgi:aminoglycoside phosphotransferase (APT) family kinase protein